MQQQNQGKDKKQYLFIESQNGIYEKYQDEDTNNLQAQNMNMNADQNLQNSNSKQQKNDQKYELTFGQIQNVVKKDQSQNTTPLRKIKPVNQNKIPINQNNQQLSQDQDQNQNLSQNQQNVMNQLNQQILDIQNKQMKNGKIKKPVTPHSKRNSEQNEKIVKQQKSNQKRKKKGSLSYQQYTGNFNSLQPTVQDFNNQFHYNPGDSQLEGGLKKQQFTSLMSFTESNKDQVWGQSAATLRHGSPQFSFGKEKRLLEIDFNKYKPKFYNTPSSLKKQTTTLGYGKKQLFRPGYLKEQLYKPSPNHYNLKRDFDVDNTKQILKIQYAQKIMIQKQQQEDQQQQIRMSLPQSQQGSRNSKRKNKNLTFNQGDFYTEMRAQSSHNSTRNNRAQSQNPKQFQSIQVRDLKYQEQFNSYKRSLSIQSDNFANTSGFPIFLLSENQKGKTFQKAQRNGNVNPQILYQASQYGKVMGVTVNPRSESQPPAPNAYNIQQNIGQDKQKVGLKSKIVYNYDNGVPSANQYNIQDKLQRNGKFSGISLGIGKKYDFVKVYNRYPGPGNYEISGFAENLANKYRKQEKLRLKNIQISL